MKEILVVLPCSRGIALGDYMKSASWQNMFKVFKKQGVDFDKVQFSAVDCIVTVFDPAKDRHEKGAIVLYPQELYRVAYYDSPPYYTIVRRYLDDLIEDLVVAIKRLFPKYKKIIICLNVLGYKKAMYEALKRTYGKYWKPDQVAFVLIPCSPAWLNHGALLVAKLTKNFVPGIVTSEKAKEGILKMGTEFDKELLQYARVIDP